MIESASDVTTYHYCTSTSPSQIKLQHMRIIPHFLIYTHTLPTRPLCPVGVVLEDLKCIRFYTTGPSHTKLLPFNTPASLLYRIYSNSSHGYYEVHPFRAGAATINFVHACAYTLVRTNTHTHAHTMLVTAALTCYTYVCKAPPTQ